MEREYLLARWPKVRAGLMAIVDAYPEDQLAFVPVKDGWTAGRIMLHISSAAEYWLHSGILSDSNVYKSGRSTLENFPTPVEIRAYLTEEHQRTLGLLEHFDPADWHTGYQYSDGYSYTPSWIFWHVLEHEIHHRGELSLILGLLGQEGLDV